MSGIVLPQQVQLTVENSSGPAAFPASMMMQQGNHIKWITMGGISKRLLIAAMIAGPPAEGDWWEKLAFASADRLIAFEEKQAAKVSA